jgi:serine/threonine protein kinase
MNAEKPKSKQLDGSPELVADTELVLDQPEALAVAELKSARPSVALPTELASEEIFAGKYKILAKIGAGGMSVVYKAQDMVLNRSVALKILSRQLSPDDKCMLRFQQEARALGAVSHGGIVSVHEFAVSEDGQQYLVMDYVEGWPLSELLARQGPLAIDRCLGIAVQAADALYYAHMKGVVHRDLKPSNIMLSKDEKGNETVKIVDFGIAKVSTLEEGLSPTQTGEIFGSPLYMSPEQCSGAKIDERTDIYSLGCVIYEMLSGRPPHVADSALATAVRHLQDLPEPLSVVRSDICFPAGLQDVVARTLAKDVNARYQSMLQLSTDLELLQKGARPTHSESAKTMTLDMRLRPWAMQTPALRRTLQQLTLIIAGLFLILIWLRSTNAIDRPGNTHPVAGAGLSKIDKNSALSPQSQYEREQTIAWVMSKIRADTGNDPNELAVLYEQIGRCYKELGRLEKSAPFYEYALKLCVDHPGCEREKEIRFEYADILQQLGQDAKVTEVFERQYLPQTVVNPVP